ncbi:hypothetical protein POV26_04475 [Aequorivita todarodis]|uniref:hypothetical protein n=1 Tax=Aequorivita todarodis TaxID=2036821 RepID=UPI002350BC15|nr:hypothetical protein [Aequorivita todarodis]MDC8000278.1 hypothetical protein [Aequorivita todarodis]
MKRHSGMRPHDILILLKILAKGKEQWYMKDLANELYISQSEVSESLNRSVMAGLIASNKKRLLTSAIQEFIFYGIKYVYPQKPGAMVRGVPTAHSAMPLAKNIQSNQKYVWPYSQGDQRGFAVEPLHPNVPKACLEDEKLYELLALLDAIRLGNVREQKMAMDELKLRLN